MNVAEELRELAQRGVGFDMNPTMMFTTAESMYSQWLDYFGRHDKAWRERVAAAADALSTPPADDVREAESDAAADVLDEAGATIPGKDHVPDEIVRAALDAAEKVRPHGTVTPNLAAATMARCALRLPHGTVTDTEALDRVRSYWRLIRGAQMDMLNGRPDMAAMEEIALASAGMDDLLMTSYAPEARS